MPIRNLVNLEVVPWWPSDLAGICQSANSAIRGGQCFGVTANPILTIRVGPDCKLGSRLGKGLAALNLQIQALPLSGETGNTTTTDTRAAGLSSGED
ncbi:MAG: hypothetical protein C5B58_13275 [Acidobacteria bacterium]|nr:MAG: hypothetical protein C5B58_13275 [Acidobacteriota bacterium]